MNTILTIPKYIDWNDKLAAHFFSESMAGRPVYLYVTKDLIEQLGKSWNAGVDDFVTAVKHGPSWVSENRVCRAARQTRIDWRRQNLRYPPYIAYLSLFTLAAATDGDFAPHAYYPRLRSLLGEPLDTGSYPYFNDMIEVWDDLETWSNQDKHGELGIFNVRIAGQRLHVGIPIAQTLLTTEERYVLPRIFIDSQISPKAQPSDGELLRVVRMHGGASLSNRTRRLLDNPHNDPELTDALIDIIRDELINWDGSIGKYEQLSSANISKDVIYGNLRLCMRIERVAKKVTMTFRCNVNQDFPEFNLHFNNEQLQCSEYLSGWSTPIKRADTSSDLNASNYNWLSGIQLESSDHKWTFRLQGSPIRIFMSGQMESLPGYVEVYQFQQGTPFIILAQEEFSATVQIWGKECCDGFKEVGVATGLPPGWCAYDVEKVVKSKPISSKVADLSFSTNIRVQFVGGIRSSHGNTFFTFARPDIQIYGGDGTEQVHCDDNLLTINPDTNRYEIPNTLPTNTRLNIKVTQNETMLKSSSFYLDSNSEWRLLLPRQEYNNNGILIGRKTAVDEAVSGAYCTHRSTTKYGLALPQSLMNFDEIYLLGRCPGQVIRLVQKGISDDWSPIWAIVGRGRKAQAVFIGNSIEDATPQEASLGTQKEIRLWKSLLWYDRRKTRLVRSTSSLRKLWTKYKGVAKNV